MWIFVQIVMKIITAQHVVLVIYFQMDNVLLIHHALIIVKHVHIINANNAIKAIIWTTVTDVIFVVVHV